MKISQRRNIVRQCVLLLSLFTGACIAAEPPADRPIRIIVNTAAAGLVDVATRLVAKKMTESLGVPVVVENRGGGDGVVAARYVLSQPADGTTLLATANSIAIRPAVKLDPGYELKDFEGVGAILRSPLFMLVALNDPAKTVSDYVWQAKEKSKSTSYASGGTGSTTHIAAAMFLRRSGLDIVHVPYKGNGAAMTDVAAGRVSMIFGGGQQLKTGQLRALGVTSSARSPAFRDVPTIAEQGLPGYSYFLHIGLLAPAGTPQEAINRIAKALRAATSDREIQERFRSEGSEVVDLAPKDFMGLLHQEMSDAAKLVADLRIIKE